MLTVSLTQGNADEEEGGERNYCGVRCIATAIGIAVTFGCFRERATIMSNKIFTLRNWRNFFNFSLHSFYSASFLTETARPV